MTSKDDDTLPLPGFSQEHSTDASVDEDFIPTTQPESTDNSKRSKISESKLTKSAEEMKSPPSQPITEDFLSPEIRNDQFLREEDKSCDFIPSTETKQTPISYTVEDISCKKKLPDFQDQHIPQGQEPMLWDTPKVCESPALENQSFSILGDTPPKITSNLETDVKREESITEIIVNDSADTVDLEQTPVKVKQSESQKVEEKLEASGSLNSDVERCEETQLFDLSSVLVLGQRDSEKSERFSGFTPEKSYLQETLDDNLQNLEVLNSEGSSLAVTELSKKGAQEDLSKLNGNISPDKEIHHNSINAFQNGSPVVCRKIDFKLSVSCCFTLNTKTNKVLHKRIIKVEEIKKPKPTFGFDAVSDNASDKSERHSTSSSGSVYSDKTGLPFVLSKRVSIVSDQTDSSEEDLAFITREQQRKLNRIPWSNEYLLPLKMDDIMQVSIENQKFLKRLPRSRRDDKVNNLKQIIESFSSEATSTAGELQPTKADISEEKVEKEETEILTQPRSDDSKQSREDLNRDNQNGSAAGRAPCSDTEGEARIEESELIQLNSENETGEVKRQSDVEDKGSSVALCEGLPVLARWTDKRYYSGILSGSAKNDRWEVTFDDGASKSLRDDFIIPVEWLKVGALVFALTENGYESGQIVDVKEGRKEKSYVVELDDEKKKIAVKITDLCMTDVMAGIIREKYKPIGSTPRGKADIDFDNVLSGKRLREHKTPLRPPVTYERGSSGGKSKASSKGNKENGKVLHEISETPMKETGRAVRGLQSENGHLVEDKVISADSPSANETTPLRGGSKKTGLKSKPRSLSYEYSEEVRSGRTTTRSYLRSDGTPVPGTSGVKGKTRKISSKANNPESLATGSGVRSSSKKNVAPTKASQSTEKSGRKRKLDEFLEHSAQKMTVKDKSSKSKRKIRH